MAFPLRLRDDDGFGLGAFRDQADGDHGAGVLADGAAPD
jgi:hypothetical protein